MRCPGSQWLSLLVCTGAQGTLSNAPASPHSIAGDPGDCIAKRSSVVENCVRILVVGATTREDGSL